MWNFDIVTNILPVHILEDIKKVTPPHPLNGEDSLAWTITSDGSFSIASSYALTAGVNGWVTMDIDGLVVDLGTKEAVGGILRDSSRCFMVAFVARLSLVSVLEAELLGIFYCLKMAWE
ncbi:hypothetical protein TSUD_101340 [Trifolium subterraneum]|uniref:RNase H type-1 domain-containing protein n=1 Tax=Trifolium subterraneum TaxID=3900 RepID=A0A2Z6MSJ6_TRISU|nr:hypothetical protein TSUD_101340 [Trifolium subterraneum]